MRTWPDILERLGPIYRDIQGGPPADGCGGTLELRGTFYTFICSWGGGWEHVSISKRGCTPSWDEMCFFKDLFWKEDETVVQFHPGRSSYVNMHKHCLHLWRPIDREIPLPPVWMV